MHSTNGRAETYAAEFDGTLRWFRNPSNRNASAHATIHADGTIALHADPGLRCWHDGDGNDARPGIELAVPAHFTHVTDEQIRSAAWLIHTWRREKGYTFALDETHLPEHRNTVWGTQAGKSDVGRDYTFARLKRWL